VTASVPAESNRRESTGRESNGPESQPQVAARSGRGTFSRSARLLRHADFERVYKLGRRHFSASMTVFYLSRPSPSVIATEVATATGSGLRVGFTVGRALGGAVQRNRMKRRLREAVRLSKPLAGPAADVVINPKKSLLITDFEEVVNEVSRAFVVIEEKLAGKTRENYSSGRERGSGSRKPGT
jgi:ribonuclease P protein component